MTTNIDPTVSCPNRKNLAKSVRRNVAILMEENYGQFCGTHLFLGRARGRLWQLRGLLLSARLGTSALGRWAYHHWRYAARSRQRQRRPSARNVRIGSGTGPIPVASPSDQSGINLRATSGRHGGDLSLRTLWIIGNL